MLSMEPIRLGAEWSWDRLGNAAQQEDATFGYLNAGYPEAKNTGVTTVRFKSAGYILGWAWDTTVRSVSHDVLFAYVLQFPGTFAGKRKAGPDVDVFLRAVPRIPLKAENAPLLRQARAVGVARMIASERYKIFAPWEHSQFISEDQAFKPFPATKSRGQMAIPGYGIPFVAGCIMWSYVYGWGHVYGDPTKHATVVELQGNIYVNAAAEYEMLPPGPQVF